MTHPHLLPELDPNMAAELHDESFMVDEASLITTHQKFHVGNEDDMFRWGGRQHARVSMCSVRLFRGTRNAA